ncbi:nickel/cobalt transporter, partial [Rhodopseudomonas sp. B29]|uniref:nickel/cobalt transporter n=1 Tax=Rhodopseudomonas sp. B29 TaxID=95607 RepID=UPI0035E3E959
MLRRSAPRNDGEAWSIRTLAVLCVALFVASVLTDAALHAAVAQNPFGAPKTTPEPQAGGIVGWLLAQQSAFYRQISATIRAAKADGTAVWTLVAISFAYGMFHAAGPGHGKAVISSYLVANQETARRGIALSFVSALLQALVAIAIVAVCAGLLSATAATMCSAEKAIEIGSYGLIALFGARLAWLKGGGLLRALRQSSAPRPMGLALAAAPAGGHDHSHHHHDHHGHDHHHHDDHGHARVAIAEAGHAHAHTHSHAHDHN